MKLAHGDGAVAVSPHHLASAAALRVIDEGGNAVDGAIAANAVLGVVLPDTCGPGGDLFALVHEPVGRAPLCLNSSGRAGSGVSADQLRADGLTAVPFRSRAAVTVPGCVDGWVALSERLGAVGLATSLAPAVELCDGFEASPELSGALTRAQDWMTATDSAAELFPGGQPPLPGQQLRRPLLGATLEKVRRGGRDAFFETVGPAITDATGGAITAADYAVGQADWVEALSLEVLGHTAWTVPPNSQGYLTLATLGVLERLGPPPDVTDPAYHYALVEAYRAVSWERNDLVADPDLAPDLTVMDPTALDERTAEISSEAPARWPDSPHARAGTAYMCVVDGAGMAVSLIQSNYTGIGSGLSAGATGVFLHNRGAGFNLVPGHPNELTTGNRPLHTLAPTLWTRGDDLAMLLGTRGGHVQPQLLAQVAAHRLVAGLDAAAAQAVPRWTVDDLAGLPPVRIEPGFPDGLDRMGHTVEVTAGPMEGWGPVSLIEIDGSGRRTGAADPRVSTAAAIAG